MLIWRRGGTSSTVLAGVAVSLTLLLLVPLFASGYMFRLLTLMLMSAALAQAWNLLGGFAGYVSFGHVAFFGLGGYATAILMTRLGWPFYGSLAAGGALVALFALVIGTPLLRVKGHYFAVVTFAIGEAMRELANNLNFVTGGGMGLQLPLYPGGIVDQNRSFYFMMLSLLAGTTAIAWLVAHSQFGYGLRAIREDEEVAAAVAINPYRHKLLALVLSALLVGLGGGIYAYWITFLEPSDLFNLSYSVNMVIMAILGGAGTVLGPILGCVVVMVLNEIVWSSFLEVHSAFSGLILIAVVLLMPRGIIDVLQRRNIRDIVSVMRSNLQRFGI